MDLEGGSGVYSANEDNEPVPEVRRRSADDAAPNNQEDSDGSNEQQEVGEAAGSDVDEDNRRIEIEQQQIENQSNSAFSIDTNVTKRRQIPKYEQGESTSRQFSSIKPSYCSALKEMFCRKRTKEMFTCDLVIKSIACNKLTHCLFDFDTQELNRPGEVEKFQFQMHKIQNLNIMHVKDSNLNNQADQQNGREHPTNDVKQSIIPYTSSNDGEVFGVEETFDDYSLYLPNRQQFITYKQNNLEKPDPNMFGKLHRFPIQQKDQEDQLALRMLFKPHSGCLWTFNKFWCPKDMFLNRQRVFNNNSQSMMAMNQMINTVQLHHQSEYMDTETHADQFNQISYIGGRPKMVGIGANPVTNYKSKDILIQDHNNFSMGNLQLKGPASHRYNRQSFVKRQSSVPKIRQESRLDRSHPLASSIVSMTNLDESTNPFFVPKDFSSSAIGKPGGQGSSKQQLEEVEQPMLTPDDLLNQINRDNDVELTTTLWKVLRNQYYAKDNELVDFCVSPTQAKHEIRIGDVVKFGRVNFKVCALRCKDKLREDIQGGYYLLEKQHQKNDLEMIEELRRIENLRTNKTVAGNPFQDGYGEESKEEVEQNFRNMEDQPQQLVRKGQSQIQHHRVQTMIHKKGGASQMQNSIFNDNILHSQDDKSYQLQNNLTSLQHILATDHASQTSTIMIGGPKRDHDYTATNHHHGKDNQHLQVPFTKQKQIYPYPDNPETDVKDSILRSAHNLPSPYLDSRRFQQESYDKQFRSPEVTNIRRQDDQTYGRSNSQRQAQTQQNVDMLQQQQNLLNHSQTMGNETMMTDEKGSARFPGNGPGEQGLSHPGLIKVPQIPLVNSSYDVGRPPLGSSKVQSSRFKTNKGFGFQSQMLIKHNFLDAEIKEEEPRVCRICLETEQEAIDGAVDQSDSERIEDSSDDQRKNNKKLKNHLICPCKCAGSMGLIHIKCLKAWVNSKRMCYKSDKLYSFFWKSLKCELCNQSFEDKMKFMMFKILKIDLPNHKNYMILESLKSAPAKVIHVFDLSKSDGSKKPRKNHRGMLEYMPYNEFRIGRSVESDMKIADISVSRVHAFIRIIGDQIFLEDNGSKFGTMVKLLKPEPVIKLDLPEESGILSKINEYDLRDRNQCLLSTGRLMLHFQFTNFQKIHIRPKDGANKNKQIIENNENSYEMWEGTLYSQRLKRKQADPFCPSSYVPAEFKEYKQDDLFSNKNINTRSNYDDDEQHTVHTQTHIENYFIANEKSKLQQRIVHGDGSNENDYQERRHHFGGLLNPTSVDLNNPSSLDNEPQSIVIGQHGHDGTQYLSPEPSVRQVPDLGEDNDSRLPSQVRQAANVLTLNDSMDMPQFVNAQISSQDADYTDNNRGGLTTQLQREMNQRMVSVINSDSSGDAQVDRGEDEVYQQPDSELHQIQPESALQLQMSRHTPLLGHRTLPQQVEQNHRTAPQRAEQAASEMYPQSSSLEQIDFQRASDVYNDLDAQGHIRISQAMRVEQTNVTSMGVIKQSGTDLHEMLNRRFSKNETISGNQLIKSKLGQPKRSQLVKGGHSSALQVLGRTNNNHEVDSSMINESNKVIEPDEQINKSQEELQVDDCTFSDNQFVSRVVVLDQEAHQNIQAIQENIPQVAQISRGSDEGGQEVLEDLSQT